MALFILDRPLPPATLPPPNSIPLRISVSFSFYNCTHVFQEPFFSPLEAATALPHCPNSQHMVVKVVC